MTLKSEAAKAVLFFLLVSPLNILAQDTTPSMRIKTPSCTIQLSVYGDGIVRTQMFQGTEMEERWEPALVAQPKTEGFTFKDGKEEAVLETPKMRVVVNKMTSQIAYYDAKGKRLTQTSEKGSTFLNQKTGGVSQQFLLSKDEHIYGIGQYVSGLPYVNGTACGLGQTNMEDAGHVLMSDRGYGMFWNNPSSGEFQSFGNQELLSDKNVKTLDGRPGFAPQLYPNDSENKGEMKGKSTEAKLSKTIDLTNHGSAVDAMQSDFDKVALKQTNEAKKGISLVYQGTIRAPNRTGWYLFNLGNSCKVRFVIDNEIVIENRIPHGFTWNSCRKWLEANKDYPYELYISNADPKLNLNLYWNPSFDIFQQYTWKSNDWKTIDYFVFAGTNSDEIMKGFYTVTGKPSILPKWSLGYIHCQAIPFGEEHVVRGFPQNDFLTLVTDYRKKQIPCDMLVQDFQWWTAMGSHIFRPDCYTDPKAWLKTMHDSDFKLMISVWPNFEKTASAKYTGEITAADLANRNELESKGLLLGDWANYVKPEARDVYWKQVAKSLYNDSFCVDAFWLDADEGGTKDPLYADAYPLLNKMTFAEGARSAFPNQRTFLLGRSMYPGSQRYDVAMWSGDVGNDFYTLKTQVSAGLSATVCGMPYWTTDIGGFGGGFQRDAEYSNAFSVDTETYRELVTRWFQYGMFCPIFRVHRANNNSAPWFYGEKAEKNITDAIKFRYRLMPYIYSLTKQTREEGRNPMRPLFMDFASDQNTTDITQQFMYGPAFLVCPVTKALYSPYKGASIETSNIQNWNVYLPKESDWFDFNTGEKLKGGQYINTPAPMERMPLFVRAGSIVPMGKVIQSTQMGKQTELELRIYPGADADFTLYDDDGVSYDYEKDGFAEIAVHWDDQAQKLTIGNRKGQFNSMPKTLTFKPIIVEKGKGSGSLIEYSDGEKIKYTGSKTEWVKK